MRMRFGRLGMFLMGCAAALSLAARGSTAQEQKPAEGEREVAHFHHVHLNVTDPRATTRFYTRIFGALPVKFMGKVDALYTGQSFILMTKVDTPPPTDIRSGIWHIGWGGIDVPSEYEWFRKQPEVKIHTELYTLGSGHVTYLDGPSGERIEVNTQGHHRYSHVHLIAEDPNKTARWYCQNLNLPMPRRDSPKPADLTRVRAWSNQFNCDNVNFIVYNQPDYTPAPPWWDQEPLKKFETSKGRPIDHLAFSFRKIDPVFEQMKKDGVEILEPIKTRTEFGGFRSFFIQGPDGVVLEIVEAKPLPDGIWE